MVRPEEARRPAPARGRGLAGYYRRSEKEMTKRKGRDNDSIAEDHCRSTFAPPAVANGNLG